jgi:hypothetical protein
MQFAPIMLSALITALGMTTVPGPIDADGDTTALG